MAKISKNSIQGFFDSFIIHVEFRLSAIHSTYNFVKWVYFNRFIGLWLKFKILNYNDIFLEYILSFEFLFDRFGPIKTAILSCELCIVYNPFFFFKFQDSTSFEDRYLTSVLLQPRSLILVCDDMYKTYLHGIEERTTDNVTDKVVNLSQCEGISIGETLSRKTRISLTIRHVPKTIKNKLIFGKR